MPIPTDLNGLTELFEKLGARNPEGWANSQVSEGFEQLHRFLFLREAWTRVLDEASTTWIDASIEEAKKRPNAPFSGIGQALERCLEKGVDPQDLTDIARGKQAEFLFNICYLLGDPDLTEPELEGVGWCLVTTDENHEPTDNVISMLHESVLETDPTNREMRPRDA